MTREYVAWAQAGNLPRPEFSCKSSTALERRLRSAAIQALCKMETVNSTWKSEVAGRKTVSSTREFDGEHEYQIYEWLSTKKQNVRFRTHAWGNEIRTRGQQENGQIEKVFAICKAFERESGITLYNTEGKCFEVNGSAKLSSVKRGHCHTPVFWVVPDSSIPERLTSFCFSGIWWVC